MSEDSRSNDQHPKHFKSGALTALHNLCKAGSMLRKKMSFLFVVEDNGGGGGTGGVLVS